jgi:hypothetical protein
MRHRTPVIAGHHIFVLYGHWAVNDPRGSGSTEFMNLKFAPLGPSTSDASPTANNPRAGNSVSFIAGIRTC